MTRQRRFQVRRPPAGGASIGGAITLLLLVAIIYAVVLGLPVFKRYYQVKEVVYITAHHGLTNRDTTALGNLLVEGAEKKKITIYPRDVSIRFNESINMIYITVGYREIVKFPPTKEEREWWITVEYETDMKRLDWKKLRDEGIF